MAQSVCRYLLDERGIAGVQVDSAAAHRDEIGNPPHYGTREKLRREGIPLIPHRARLLTAADGERYDYFIGMDDANVRDMRRILGGEHADQIYKLLDFTARPRAIADPWYTGDFEETYSDIVYGLNAFLDYLERERKEELL